ncbi:MAG: hypothetical protein M1482_02635 [Chloroflexi bacterium]|nr:hypothetical protein [Chloroflexota bacterium]
MRRDSIGAADRPAMAGRITARFADLFAATVAVQVRFVDSVQMTAGGKINPVVPLRRWDS